MANYTSVPTNSQSPSKARGNNKKSDVGNAQNGAKRVLVPTDDELARRYIAAHPDICYGLGAWRQFVDGVWKEIDTDLVESGVRQVLVDAKFEGVRPNAYEIYSVTKLVKLSPAVLTASNAWDNDPDLVVCANGVLRLSTRELMPHDPKFKITHRLSFDYDPLATAPIWTFVLDTSIPDVAHFLQDYAGLCLTTEMKYETAVWLKGPKGSGKSTVIEGFRSMLGNRAGTLSLAAIERSRFALDGIAGKTLVSATEQPAAFMSQEDIVSSIISGEGIWIDRKNRPHVEIFPVCKVLWSMNEYPRVAGSSGIFRRIQVVEFPDRPESDRDPEIKEAIKREGAGILNWALDGLARLRARGKFDIPECVKTSNQDFESYNDVARAFLDEYYDKVDDGREQASILYDNYKSWCVQTGHKPSSSTSVAEDWKRLKLDKKLSGGLTYYWGIKRK